MKAISVFLKNNKLLIVIILVVLLFFVGRIVYSKINMAKFKVDDYEMKEKSSYLTNEFMPIRYELEDLLNSYFKEFVDEILNNQDKGYNRLTDYSKKLYSEDKYKERIKNNKINSSTKLVKYRKITNSQYYLYDSNNNNYVLFENGVWNFEIEIN